MQHAPACTTGQVNLLVYNINIQRIILKVSRDRACTAKETRNTKDSDIEIIDKS